MKGDASHRLLRREAPAENRRRRRNRRRGWKELCSSRSIIYSSACITTSRTTRLQASLVLLIVATFLFTGLPLIASWSLEKSGASRRSVLQRIAVGSFGTVPTVLLASASSRPAPAWAKNLPDPVSVDTSKSGTAETLEPILNVEATLKDMLAQIALASKQQPQPLDAVESLTTKKSTIPTTETKFKAIFDAYSDPISYKQRFVDQNAFLVYYSKGFDGPGRPSIEFDLPVKQTLQYGTRNDAWVAWDAFRVELDFQRQHPEEADAAELQRLLQTVVNAVDAYLKVSGVR